MRGRRTKGKRPGSPARWGVLSPNSYYARVCISICFERINDREHGADADVAVDATVLGEIHMKKTLAIATVAMMTLAAPAFAQSAGGASSGSAGAGGMSSSPGAGSSESGVNGTMGNGMTGTEGRAAAPDSTKSGNAARNGMSNNGDANGNHMSGGNGQ